MSWICRRCETENPDELNECEVCGCSLQVCLLEEKLESIEKENENLKRERSGYLQTIEDQMNEIMALSHTERILERDKMSLQEKIAETQKEIIVQKNKASKLEQENSKMTREHKSRLDNLNNTIKSLQKENDEKDSKITKLQVAVSQNDNIISSLRSIVSQKGESISSLKTVRNILCLLLLVSLIPLYLFLFPNEVAHKDMGEYYYYGPIKNNKPSGKGVAIYKKNDTDGRAFYYGNFKNGIRCGENEILFYNDNSFFKGKMLNGSFNFGMYFHSPDFMLFRGTFENNEPAVDKSKGVWYILKSMRD